jgi:hypothetical protein
MDTLSSLFSKNFKKTPKPPQFHGINEDLYEGKKLISKRRRIKNKIAKKSPLVEGFGNRLDNVTLSEDQETVDINAELQRNLSSYATALKTTVGDYVSARREERICKAECDNLKAATPQCNEEDVTGCTTCESCYSQGPGWWCPDTGQCSTHGNPCQSNCSAVCTANNLASCTTCETCYAQGPGWWCSDTGTCQGREEPCSNGEMPSSCGQGGLQTSQHINQILNDDGATETNNKKQACIAGCGLSKAYLEQTEQVGTFKNQTINDCEELAPPPDACNDCAYGRSDFWGGAYDYDGEGYGWPLEPSYWRQEVCEDQNAGTGCCNWVPNEEICTGYECGMGYCEQVKDVWCPGGRGENADPPCNDSAEGQMRIAACNNSDALNTDAINQVNEGRNLTQEYSSLNENYLRGSGRDGDGELRYMAGYNLGGEGVWGGEILAGSPTGNIMFSDAIQWCRDSDACKGVSISSNTVPTDGDEYTVGSNLFFESSATGNTFYSGGGVGWHSWCKGGCGQNEPQTPNILVGDANSISSRLSDILGLRQDLKGNNESTRQNLTNALNDYKYRLEQLKAKDQDTSTVGAMMEEGKLNKTSASFKYYIWLGLAIFVLIVAIRKLKK